MTVEDYPHHSIPSDIVAPTAPLQSLVTKRVWFDAHAEYPDGSLVIALEGGDTCANSGLAVWCSVLTPGPKCTWTKKINVLGGLCDEQRTPTVADPNGSGEGLVVPTIVHLENGTSSVPNSLGQDGWDAVFWRCKAVCEKTLDCAAFEIMRDAQAGSRCRLKRVDHCETIVANSTFLRSEFWTCARSEKFENKDSPWNNFYSDPGKHFTGILASGAANAAAAQSEWHKPCGDVATGSHELVVGRTAKFIWSTKPTPNSPYAWVRLKPGAPMTYDKALGNDINPPLVPTMPYQDSCGYIARSTRTKPFFGSPACEVDNAEHFCSLPGYKKSFPGSKWFRNVGLDTAKVSRECKQYCKNQYRPFFTVVPHGHVTTGNTQHFKDMNCFCLDRGLAETVVKARDMTVEKMKEGFGQLQSTGVPGGRKIPK